MQMAKAATPMVCHWCLLVVGAGIASRPAHAWDSPGHMQIADIAWSRLNNKAIHEIAAILMAGDSHFRPVSATDEQAIRDAFRRAATFPDFIKQHAAETVYRDIIATMNSKWHPETDALVSPSEKALCKTWHYYDSPIRYNGAIPGIARSNAYMALTTALREIARSEKTPAPDRGKQCWWLYWIVHITGDLHQPLHCTSNFQHLAYGDAGGNLFPVNNEAKELHAYWDAGIDHAVAADRAQHLPVGVTDVSARWASTAPSPSTVAVLDPKQWISEGSHIADNVAYVGIAPHASPTSDYLARQISVCRSQAVLGGYRLAEMLNRILGAP